MIAVVVTLALIAAIAAVAVPVLAGHQQMQDVTEAREILQSLEYSITNSFGSANGATGFWSARNSIPGRLSQLVIPITSSDRKCSGSTYNGGDIGHWSGPYSGLYIAFRVGVQTPIGTIRDTVLPVSNPKVPSGDMGFVMDSVTADDARLLDLLVDGTSPPDSANGRLVYDASPTWPARRVVYYLSVESGC
ncbi:MAG TPA: hypothetical protein VN651_19070 [Gemmatimonadaceae bacterium]|nr:hypothetical protein [Gemmatimonadaceae bacterium]